MTPVERMFNFHFACNVLYSFHKGGRVEFSNILDEKRSSMG